jgi:hypothetical protein
MDGYRPGTAIKHHVEALHAPCRSSRLTASHSTLPSALVSGSGRTLPTGWAARWLPPTKRPPRGFAGNIRPARLKDAGVAAAAAHSRRRHRPAGVGRVPTQLDLRTNRVRGPKRWPVGPIRKARSARRNSSPPRNRTIDREVDFFILDRAVAAARRSTQHGVLIWRSTSARMLGDKTAVTGA